MTCATLYGGWVIKHPVTNDEFGWSGSAVVLGPLSNGPPDRICLATNHHCLALAELSTGCDRLFAQGVSSYAMQVVFPSGKRAQVRRIAGVLNPGPDLALLEVDAAGLQEGVDYSVALIPAVTNIQVMDQVIAIGAPAGLTGTVTKGNVSAIREASSSDSSTNWTWIQHTAPINHGKSGGPLFAERDGGYLWVGINTLTLEGTQGLYFAIQCDALHATTTKYSNWVTCDAAGAADLLGVEGHPVRLAK
jgi:hypothetical protein